MSPCVALLNAGRFVELERAARELLIQYPNSGLVWKALGVSLGMQGKDALQAWERTVKLLPDDAETHCSLGATLQGLGQLERAVVSYRRALEIRPDYPELYNNLGKALQDLEQFDAAVENYRQALKIKPDFAVAHSNLGNALQRLGRFDEAAASCRRALTIVPNFAVAHCNLGIALRGLGRFDEAVTSYRRALEIKPDFAEVHYNLANALHDLRQLDEAVVSYRRALEIKPRYAEALCNLGNVLRSLGQLDEAVASYRQALVLKPGFLEVYNSLGNALQNLGQLDAAAQSYRRALLLKPDVADAHNNLGNSLLDLGQHDEAVTCYRRALVLNSDYAEAHNNLGIALRQQNRIAEAEASCRRALEINPHSPATVIFLGQLHADKGKFPEAENLFKRAISIEPRLPEAWAGIAGLRKMTSNDADWLVEAQRLAGDCLPPRQEAHLRYAIGKYFDDVRDFGQAFINYRRANELAKLNGAKYDRHRLTQSIDLITHTYDRNWLTQASVPNSSQRPVLIIGMPRSGTTLVEQILASHPSVFGAGELTYWSSASAAYEASLRDRETTNSIIDKLANDYLRLLREASADALCVVDKMPANFLYLGLVHAALPKARIIHMRRNPIDTCLSIYFQHFGTAHRYANDLDDLAHYYAAYSRVMEHWRSTLPENSILEVSYEGLVADPETWSRKMLDFIGVPWDPICLEFERTDRTVNTFSKWQARQKISNSSVGRWRNYERFVGPLRHLAE